ncbi:TetR/AcrR family transcriptional regulator [Actinomadura parmotrematis]|uniref:TetR/AcrR family transcriptional regulator n=1 Tax=Actinomadura parmotrematis TaxID=2864039 RepID=A0ABS7FUE8_9ACTN|nr:TetR/AcrR family transcriptional regulator [Actinomadura parmotrematis]MBW8484023.1 TetR/AcrR family transcriptional regulator [Actinomadura parmotrematis]
MTEPRAPRADARRNRAILLDVAAEVVAEQGAQASLRDIARRAGVGMGTLYRHFATREELLGALLGARFDRLAARADALAAELPPLEALTAWLDEFTAGTTVYRGLAPSLMASADGDSPLKASCDAFREAGGRLLARAQASGDIRPDVDGGDLFALAGGVATVVDQSPVLAARRERLIELILGGLRAR